MASYKPEKGQTQKRLATKKTSDTTFNKEKRKRNKATKEEGSSAKRDNESKVNYDARRYAVSFIFFCLSNLKEKNIFWFKLFCKCLYK